MQNLTAEGRRIVDDVAQRQGISSDAVVTLLMALVAGQGTQAQFNHPELGGMGQWSQGGMIMVGDMFNNNLKHRVDALCSELSNLLRSHSVVAAVPAQSQSQSQSPGWGPSGVSLFVPGSTSSGNWWPADLGAPSSTGAQNDLRYSYFPSTCRLAILQNGQITVYDLGDHEISGFSQQQSGDQSLMFTSQHGLVRVADLPVVGRAAGDNRAASSASPPSDPTAAAAPLAPQMSEPVPARSSLRPAVASTVAASDDIFIMIERLADLHQRGIVTNEEFEGKKRELMSRL